MTTAAMTGPIWSQGLWSSYSVQASQGNPAPRLPTQQVLVGPKNLQFINYTWETSHEGTMPTTATAGLAQLQESEAPDRCQGPKYLHHCRVAHYQEPGSEEEWGLEPRPSYMKGRFPRQHVKCWPKYSFTWWSSWDCWGRKVDVGEGIKLNPDTPEAWTAEALVWFQRNNLEGNLSISVYFWTHNKAFNWVWPRNSLEWVIWKCKFLCCFPC